MDRLVLEYQRHERYRELDVRTPTLLTMYGVEWYLQTLDDWNAHGYRALF